MPWVGEWVLWQIMLAGHHSLFLFPTVWAIIVFADVIKLQCRILILAKDVYLLLSVIY